MGESTVKKGATQGDTISSKLFFPRLEEVLKNLKWDDRN